MYISPNALERDLDKFLDDLGKSIRGKELIGGDFNANSPMWGSPVEDRKRGLDERQANGLYEYRKQIYFSETYLAVVYRHNSGGRESSEKD